MRAQRAAELERLSKVRPQLNPAKPVARDPAAAGPLPLRHQRDDHHASSGRGRDSRHARSRGLQSPPRCFPSSTSFALRSKASTPDASRRPCCRCSRACSLLASTAWSPAACSAGRRSSCSSLRRRSRCRSVGGGGTGGCAIALSASRCSLPASGARMTRRVVSRRSPGLSVTNAVIPGADSERATRLLGRPRHRPCARRSAPRAPHRRLEPHARSRRGHLHRPARRARSHDQQRGLR